MKNYIYLGMIGVASLTSCKKDNSISEENKNVETFLTDELKQFAPEEVTTKNNSDEIIRIVTEKGNIIVFPKNAFSLNGVPVTGDVEIAVTEMSTKSEMIFSDLMTNSDEGPLDSRGEFNIKVSQNGNELQLADGVEFTIENPTGVNTFGMKSWYWNENTLTGTGIQNGEWTAGTNVANDPCEILNELKTELLGLNPLTETQKVSNLLNSISSLIYSRSVSDGNNDQLMLYLDRYTFNSGSDSWYFEDSSQVLQGGISIYGNKGEYWNSSDTSIADIYTPNGYVMFGLGCSYSIYNANQQNAVSVILDTNVITVKFNQLGFCNIDALIDQYGALYDCEILIDKAPLISRVHFIFPDLNGVLSCTSIKDGEFSIERLPEGMPIQVVVYYKDGDKIKFGTETIIASKKMVFDTSKIITLNGIDELMSEIAKFD